MTNNQAIHCLGVYADESVCEECDFYPDCTHETQSDMARLAISAIRRQIPKKPYNVDILELDAKCGNCAICGDPVYNFYNFCPVCGNALDW